MRTAVDQLIEKMSLEDVCKYSNELAEAKEMEQEYIVNAHYQGYRSSIGTTEISEQYYNETFKQQEQ
jgi:hypothetical protein